MMQPHNLLMQPFKLFVHLLKTLVYLFKPFIAMGALARTVLACGATMAGKRPAFGYHFEQSQGLAEADYFYGLALDEDQQPELTAERISTWIYQLSPEFVNSGIIYPP
jgi:hypothetical protein